MSHGDYAESLPSGFEIIGQIRKLPTAAIRDSSSRFYAVQFHPEVAHTEKGEQIIRNFVTEICGCSPKWTAQSIITTAIEQIRSTIGARRVLVAVSGGIDSTTSAVLAQKALGDNLTCIFVNHGLLRKDEEHIYFECPAGV